MTNLRSKIEEISKRTPHADALLALGRNSASYVSLLAQIDETARWLASRGIRREDRVAVVMPNGPEMASLFLALSSVATCAPLNPAYRASEFEFYLSDLQPKIVIVDGAMDSAARGVALEAGIEIVELHRRDLAPAGSFSLGPDDGLPTPNVVVDYAAASNVALVLHTSGTTSRPKIVPLTHQNLCASATGIARSLELTANDRCLNIMPLFHVHGLVGALLSSLFAGASVVCAPGYQATEFFTWLAEFHPTWYTGVPTMHHGILTRAAANSAILAAHPLRFIRSCSAALPPTMMAELEKTFGVPVLEAYGMTEAAHQMSCNGLPPRARKPGSVGRATGIEIAIRAEAGARWQPGAEGEVVIRGQSVTRGYQNNPEANLKSFTDGWFRTGDQGRFDNDGDLFLTGRIKELIVRGGEKIAPREIDEALLSHPAVAQALAFAVPDAVLGERVAAAVVLKAQASVTELELCEHAARLLADFKVPEKIVFLSEIPKGPTGKQQRIGLAEKLGLGSLGETPVAASREYCAPRNETETRLAEMWREVLRLEHAGIHDNFFAIGGDSILAGQLIARIRYAFGVELSAPRMFQLPTIARLAEFIEGQSASTPADRSLPTVNRAGGLPLTTAQQRMGFQAELEPDSPIYNRPFAYRLKGCLDLFRLQSSLNAVVQRHEILRTNYRKRDGIPIAIVGSPHPVSIALEDLSSQPATQRDALLLQWMQKESAQPFKLETDPVMRCSLVRLASDEHILFLVIHHIACDASAEPAIVKDIADAYNGALSSTLIPQYADYAAWQCAHEAAAKENQLSWWVQHLAGPDNACEIPGDFARNPIAGYKAGSVPMRVDAGTLERCKAIAAAANTTVFTVLLAAFNALLHRYTRAEEIVVGTPVSIRNHPAAESMVGLFINTLALRTSAAGNPTFREFLSRVRETVVGGLEHQEVPFDAVVSAVRAQRDRSRSPLFHLMFEYRNIETSRLEMEGIVAERLEFDRGFNVGPFDLTLDIEPYEGGLRGHFYYDADLFLHATVERFAKHFATLLGHAIHSPDVKLLQLSLMTPDEQTQVLAMGQRTEVFPVAPIHKLFEEQVDRLPNSVALVFEDQRMTYRELNARANQLANYLRNLGVGPESLVGLLTERSLDMIVGLLGILKAGGAYLPIDTAYPKDRIGFMLEDAEVRVLLTQKSLLDSTSGSDARVVCLDADWETIARENPANLSLNIDPGSLAYVIYTSGSTGKPKGCLVTHANVVRLMRATEAWFHFDASDVWTLFHSHAFDFSVWEIWGALLYGGKLVVVPSMVSRSPDLFHRLLCEQRVTVLNLTPSAFRQFAQADEAAEGADLALRWVMLGGEELQLKTLRAWFDRHGDRKPRLVNLYGITETTVLVTCRPLSMQDAHEGRGSMIGFPIPDLSLYILDSLLQPTPIGVPGELHVAGAGVARGYLNRPDLTRERFIANPFSPQSADRLYRSGDLVRRLADGDMEYLGRIDQQIKIRGFRIELGEIESALRQHIQVIDAVVIVDGKEADARLIAYIVSGSPAPSAAELRNHLSAMLPDYMLPSIFVLIDAVPLTPHGKVDRRALPSPIAGNIATAAEYIAPRTPTERELAAIWQELLEVERVGITENFFEIGGHSLSAMRVVARMQSIHDLDIPVSCLFLHPTIESLAAEVDVMRVSAHSDEDLLRILDEIDAMPSLKAEGK